MSEPIRLPIYSDDPAIREPIHEALVTPDLARQIVALAGAWVLPPCTEGPAADADDLAKREWWAKAERRPMDRPADGIRCPDDVMGLVHEHAWRFGHSMANERPESVSPGALWGTIRAALTQPAREAAAREDREYNRREATADPVHAMAQAAREASDGIDAVTWAELLIRDMPRPHNGRDSWLLNYGHGADVERMRDEHPTYRKMEAAKKSSPTPPADQSAGDDAAEAIAKAQADASEVWLKSQRGADGKLAFPTREKIVEREFYIALAILVAICERKMPGIMTLDMSAKLTAAHVKAKDAEITALRADVEKYKGEMERHVYMLSEAVKERDQLAAKLDEAEKEHQEIHDQVADRCYAALEAAEIEDQPDGGGQPDYILPAIVEATLSLLTDKAEADLARVMAERDALKLVDHGGAPCEMTEAQHKASVLFMLRVAEALGCTRGQSPAEVLDAAKKLVADLASLKRPVRLPEWFMGDHSQPIVTARREVLERLRAHGLAVEGDGNG